MADNNFTDKIQDAIDSSDYGALSDAVQNLVTDAVTDALGEIGDNVNKAADIIAGRAKPVDRRPDYMKNPDHKVEPAQNPWIGTGSFERAVESFFTGRDITKEDVYSMGPLSKVKGYLLTIFGITGLCGSVVGLLVLFIVGAIMHAGMLPAKILLVILIALFGFMTVKGFGILNRIKRFRNYVKKIGRKVRITVKELSTTGRKSEKDTAQDLKEMIRDGMFLQGHLSVDGSELFITDEAYDEYIKEAEQMLEKIQLQKFTEEKKAAEEAALKPEVRKILEDGLEYIDMIRSGNEAIEDPAVSEKLEKLESMTAQIFDYVKEHPGSADGTKKLMKYYLPTTIKLLDSYQKLTEAQMSGQHPEQTKNIEKSKKEIEETLDTLNQAFARLFDNLYQDTSMDISADISVLNTMLAQEGLAGKNIRDTDVEKKQDSQGQVMQSH